MDKLPLALNAAEIVFFLQLSQLGNSPKRIEKYEKPQSFLACCWITVDWRIS